MAKSPAFQFYPDDFMGGKPGMMTPEQTHVYIWLLCLDWNQNGFPFDVPVLARWCRVTPSVFRKAWAVVQECFSCRDGRWFNDRLAKEHEKQEQFKTKMANNGKLGGRPKKAAGSIEESQPKPDHNLTESFPSPLPSPTPVTTKPSASQKRRAEPLPWMGRVVDAWQTPYPGTKPPPGTATALKPLFARMGEDAAIQELQTYLAQTPATYLNFGKFAATAGLGPHIQISQNNGRMNPADRISQTIAEMTGTTPGSHS